MSQTNGETPKKTPEEEQILDEMKEEESEEWVEANAAMILNQARLVGDL
jgi:hypothetical protein